MMTIRELRQAFQDADDAWQSELVRRFGRDAGQARYEKRGRGAYLADGNCDPLGTAFLRRGKLQNELHARTGDTA